MVALACTRTFSAMTAQMGLRPASRQAATLADDLGSWRMNLPTWLWHLSTSDIVAWVRAITSAPYNMEGRAQMVYRV